MRKERMILEVDLKEITVFSQVNEVPTFVPAGRYRFDNRSNGQTVHIWENEQWKRVDRVNGESNLIANAKRVCHAYALQYELDINVDKIITRKAIDEVVNHLSSKR